MPGRLRIYLGREAPKSVELADDSIEVTDDFVIEIENHGHPQHIHIAPADELGRFVMIEEANHFIETGDALAIHASVMDDRPPKFDGRLRIVTGYGTDETFVEINLRQPGDIEREVAVDENLAKPQSDTSEAPLMERLISPDAIPILALAAMAVLIAVGATLIATDAAVVLGVIAVLVGVGIAIVLLLR